MRISVIIDEHLQVYEIFNISDANNGYLLAPIVPHGEPLVISNVPDPISILYRVTVHGWADLSMYPAHYLTDTVENADDEQTDDDDMEREIDQHELEH